MIPTRSICFRFCLLVAAVCSFAFQTAEPCSAQGLVWSIPAAGTGVRYSGEYSQTIFRPESQQGDISLRWRRLLEIRCLNQTQADFEGETVDCVWLEYEVTTGEEVNSQIEAGPGGTRLYKVLVPLSEIRGLESLQQPVPSAFLPIVKGFQKIGDDAVEPLENNVLQVFPLITQVIINETAKVAGEESVNVTAGNYNAKRINCTFTIEDTTSRTTNQTSVWMSEDIPFGTSKWTVRVDREKKTPVDTRDQFQKHSELSVEMQAEKINQNVVAKLSNE